MIKRVPGIDSLFEACLHSFTDPLFILSSDRDCIFGNAAFNALLGVKASQKAPIDAREFWPDIKAVNLSNLELTTELLVQGSKEAVTAKLGISNISGGFKLVTVRSCLLNADTPLTFHTQRLETLGLLASGIAHDFNNVLAGILGHITYLKNTLPGKGPHIQSLAAIEEGARRASTMTQQILKFSKLDVAEKPRLINITDLTARTCNLLRGAIPPQYNLECDVPETALSILGGEAQFAQIIVNLVVNARDAIERDGDIKIQLRLDQDVAHLKQVFGERELSTNAYACLSVSDNGQGISKDVLERMFEPYFSTKSGKGTGLGLATVDSIVRSLGGAINVWSEVGRGSCVSIYLPAIESAQQSITERAADVLRRGSERILVVDDESPVRNVLTMSLKHLGYQVDMASSGSEAFQKYADPKSFDLVILDMLMPKFSGEQVFSELKKIDPKVKVLLISGYTSEDVIKSTLKSGALDFIQKPFTIEELSKKVRECLEGVA